MSAMIRSFVSGGLMAAIAMMAMVHSAQADTPAQREAAARRGARAALSGKATNVKINGHDFTVKRAFIATTSDSATIRGTISHQLSFRPDDQLHYTIIKVNGKVISFRTSISQGGLAPVIGAVANKIGPDWAANGLASMVSSLGAWKDGSWESAGHLIAAAVAEHAPDSRSAVRAGKAPYQPKSSKK